MKGYTPREAHDSSEMAYFILATSYNQVVFNSIEHNVQSVALVADLYCYDTRQSVLLTVLQIIIWWWDVESHFLSVSERCNQVGPVPL